MKNASFCIVPMDVFAADLTLEELRIFLLLCAARGRWEPAYVPWEQLAEDSGYTEREVRHIVSGLERKGWARAGGISAKASSPEGLA